MIPKIIHQVWEGRTEYLRDSYKLLSKTWKEHHPNWEYKLWEENQLDDLVYEYFPEMINTYFGYQYSIQRWHVIRYLILYKMGGLYVDFDYECLEPFDKHLKDDCKCYFASEANQNSHSSDKGFNLNNALMATSPCHQFFKYIIEHLQTMRIHYSGNKYREILNTTGSIMLTNQYKLYTAKNDVAIFSSEQVSPLSREEVQNYINGKANEAILEEKLQKAIAIHYYWGSWIIKNNSYLSTKKGLTHMPVSDLYDIFMLYPVICIDSHDCPPDSLFFATPGYQSDGNKFASEALESGCRYAIVDDPEVITDDRYILVDNVQQSLLHLAEHHHQILKTPVIGITGTCGKTTTKDLISAVLSTRYNLVCTPGSENVSLNAALTLLRLKPEHEIAVIEMGACRPGMIRESARVTQPNYGIITNIGVAHLDRFGSLDVIKNSKEELYSHIRQSGGKIFIQKENIFLESIAKDIEQISYGESKDAFVSGQMISSDPCLSLEWENERKRHTIVTQLAGGYNLMNVLAAIAVGVYFDVPSKQINQAISRYMPNNYRSQWKITSHNKLVIDTFNANPTSMLAALANFHTLKAKPKAVILGDMLGLGTDSLTLHMEIISKLNGYNFDKVFLCGSQFTATDSGYSCFPDIYTLCQYLSLNPFQNWTILIKGSNKMNMESTIHLL